MKAHELETRPQASPGLLRQVEGEKEERSVAGGSSGVADAILRLQRTYGNRYTQGLIARAADSGEAPEVAPEVEESIQRARGGGQALDNSAREQMEPAFGVDFGHVRVHTGTEADGLNRAVNARAFTTGQDIFFREGEYSPTSSDGRELLAHELTHVVQQSDGVQRKLSISEPGDQYEQEADKVARVIVQGEQSVKLHGTSSEQVRRQAEDEEDEPSQTSIPDLRLQRRAASSTVQSPQGEEHRWSAGNRAGGADARGPGRYVLWNFDVGSDELKPEHEAQLDNITAQWQISKLDDEAEIRIDGHASKSSRGGQRLNETLSEARAWAVFAYLHSRGVDVDKMDVHQHGFSAPWFPNLTGSSKARNRRVEVQIIRPANAKPSPRPTVEPPDKEPTPVEQPSELGDWLPGGEFTIKVPIDLKYARPLGPYLLIYPSGEINGKFKIKTHGRVTIAGYWKSSKFGVDLKAKLIEGIFEGKIGSSGVGLSFYDIPFHPEVVWQPWELDKPVSLNVSESIPVGELAVGEDIQVTGGIEVKIKFGMGPGPALIAHAGVMVVGTVASTAALTYAMAYVTSQAREKGDRVARYMALRSAYAWRVAGETGNEIDYSIAVVKVNEYQRLQVWNEARMGWKIADEGINALSVEERNALSKILTRYSSNLNDVQQRIFWLVGGDSDNDAPLPINPGSLMLNDVR